MISVSEEFIALRQESLERITSDKDKLLRLYRSIQSEGAFPVLKQDSHFKQFARRAQTMFSPRRFFTPSPTTPTSYTVK